jgi:hypothetical protein
MESQGESEARGKGLPFTSWDCGRQSLSLHFVACAFIPIAGTANKVGGEKKAGPIRPLVWILGMDTNPWFQFLHGPCRVVMDEVHQQGALTFCEFPKLHATASFAQRSVMGGKGYEIRNGFARYVMQSEGTVYHEYIQFIRLNLWFLAGNIIEGKTMHADVYDSPHTRIRRLEHDKGAVVHLKPLLLPAFHLFRSVLDRAVFAQGFPGQPIPKADGCLVSLGHCGGPRSCHG